MHELDLGEGHAGCFQRFDGCIESTGMPSDRDRHVAQLAERLDCGLLAYHQRAGAHRGVQPNDLATAERLYAFDRAPFAHRINLKRAFP